MINREDMLELTRRMTLARTSFTRIAGCYVDKDGDFDGSFNTNFLKLSSPERTKKLALAKEIPFSPTNVNLKKYEFPQSVRKPGSMWQSEEVFEYIICAVCPLSGEYEPGKPEYGFLFPAFTDRSADLNHIDIFQIDAKRPHNELLETLGVCPEK